MPELSAEDTKLVTLARATRARTGSREGAAVRDLDCRRIGDIQFYDTSPEQPPFNYPHPEKPTLYRYQFNALVHARHVQGDI